MSPLLSQLSTHARLRPHALAYREISTNRTLTYADLLSSATDLSRKLPPHSTILLRLPNSLEYPIAFLATLLANSNPFPLPPEISDPELHRATTESQATHLISPTLSLSQLGTRNSELGTSASKPGTGNRELGTPSLLLQSSGTTGLPKIASRPLPTLDAVSHNMVTAINFTPNDHVLATVPLCHSYGLEHGLLAPLYAGSTTHLAQGFNLPLLLPELTKPLLTILPATPSLFEILSSLPHTPRFPSLQTCYSAGGPLPPSIFQSFKERHALPISQLYGATEIGSVTFTPPTHPHFNPTSVGHPMQGVDIRISQLGTRNSELGTSAPQLGTPEEGEVQIHAPSMFTGYLTGNSTITNDGYFPTGDLGKLDEHGNLIITGRLKLLIDVGGLKVNPLEVESLLTQHPAVAAAVVLPLPQSPTVNRLKAIIQPTDPSNPPTADALRSFARAHLTPHKIPRLFEFRPSLPTSPTGKILRHLLTP